MSVAGTGFTPDLQLVGPDGLAAATGDNDTNVTITLPQDGEYTAIVRGGGPASIGNGPYLISVSDPHPTPIPIAFGERLAGQVHVPGDFVEYELVVTAAEVGQPVSIVHSAVSDASTAYYASQLELYAPDGSLLESRSGSYYTHALEIDDFVLPVAGTYTIRVFEGGNDATGSFTIGVSDQPIQTPHPLPAFNTAISGALELLGDVDDYTFDGDAGQIVTVERLSSNFDLTLFDASGAVIAGGGDADALLDLITLPVDGSYTIRVEPSGGSLSSALDDVGAYSFTVWTPNRTPEATAIGFGHSLPGQIATRGDIVEYELSVTAAEVGQPVSIVHSAVT